VRQTVVSVYTALTSQFGFAEDTLQNKVMGAWTDCARNGKTFEAGFELLGLNQRRSVVLIFSAECLRGFSCINLTDTAQRDVLLRLQPLEHSHAEM